MNEFDECSHRVHSFCHRAKDLRSSGAKHSGDTLGGRVIILI